MPKPRAAKLETATARRRLEVRKKPYWTTISPGIGWATGATPGRAPGAYAVPTATAPIGSSALDWPTILNRPTASMF